ncbi:SDR family NAD(P)-dependent oxidoreductase [Streptomyces phaeochromogenes]
MGVDPLDGADRGSGVYGRMAQAGYEYGPAFQCLGAVWRGTEDDLFAEVALPEELHEEATRFGIHPALLDAALHAVVAEDLRRRAGEVWLPFAFHGIRLLASGASALRVHLKRSGEGEVSARLADASGQPVAVVRSLVSRPAALEDLRSLTALADDSLFVLRWKPLPVGHIGSDGSPRALVMLGSGRPMAGAKSYAGLDALADAVAGGLPLPDSVVWPMPSYGGRGSTDPSEAVPNVEHVHDTVNEVLDKVREWLADERFSEVQLVVVTRGAQLVHGGPDSVLDLAQAAALGALRSAATENPDRFLLVDLDGDGNTDEDAAPLLHRAVMAAREEGETQVALRDGTAFVPRLARGTTGERAERQAQDDRGEGAKKRSASPARPVGDGTVLITGGTGTLGAVVAHHLVAEHGVKNLVLISRHGMEAPGALELREQLRECGAAVDVVACDAADRDGLGAVLRTLPESAPLTGIVHAAGAVDDGLIGAMDREQVQRVLRPKVDAALNLYHLTRGLDLRMFVLFSSAAGVVGSAGQSNYAAANAFLDALIRPLRAQGTRAVSLGWGIWEEPESALVRKAGEDTERRMARKGFLTLPTGVALHHFDTAIGGDGDEAAEELLVPVRLDLARLREEAAAGVLFPLFRDLVRQPVRRGRASGYGSEVPNTSLTAELAALPEAEREHLMLSVVRTHVASVLGHASPEAVDAGRGLADMGIDSLAAVQLRNRLSAATGLRLPATLAFDRPTSSALAAHLLAELGLENDGSVAERQSRQVAEALRKAEQALSVCSPDEATREQLAQMLRDMLRTVEKGGARKPDGDDEHDVAAATNEEMFELIDRELGSL